MDNFKYYSYNISGFKGYKYITEKSYIKSLKKLEYDGFHVIYDFDYMINFKMDIKVVRKLKLMKLSKEIKINSKEYKLSKLLELSTEKEETHIISCGAYGTYSGSYDYYDYDTKVENEYKKESNKYQSKFHSLKAKQYENKTRFRK
jgi:hypothetical protein